MTLEDLLDAVSRAVPDVRWNRAIVGHKGDQMLLLSPISGVEPGTLVSLANLEKKKSIPRGSWVLIWLQYGLVRTPVETPEEMVEALNELPFIPAPPT